MAKENTWRDKIMAYGLKNAIEHSGKCQEGSIISSLFHEGLEKDEVRLVITDVKDAVSKINSMSLEEQEKRFKELEEIVGKRPEREGLPELENVKGKVVMRFAPSPSGPMHIGHAATGMPSSLYVKRYGGEFYLRIEDTNPENIDSKSYKMLSDEASWLFGNVTEVIIQSDRLEVYYKYAEEFIKRGRAYVCTCSQEKFKELVDKGKPCPCRDNDLQENLTRWAKMLDKKGYKPGEVVLRFKSDLKINNPALRDFPLARVNLTPHPRVRDKYRVWPLMNLAVFADDLEYNMTHIIRAKDHADNAKRQEMMYRALELDEIPVTLFLGRYNFTNLEISASKTRKAIEEGKYSGWDDVRLPFLASLKKRGYTREAFIMMAEQRGLSDVDKVLSQEDYFEILNEFNRKVLKEVAKSVGFSESEKGKFKIVMPDNKTRKFNSEVKPKISGIYYLKGLGYSRFDKDGKFYFTHK